MNSAPKRAAMNSAPELAALLEEYRVTQRDFLRRTGVPLKRRRC